VIENQYTVAPEMGATLRRYQSFALIAGVIGLVGCLLGIFLDHGLDHLFRSWLMGFVLWWGIALGSLALLMLQYTTGGAWGVVIRRTLEAGTRTLPLMAILFIPLLFGIQSLYEWARPAAAHDQIVQLKSAYLNVPFFIVRQIAYFAIWIGMELALNRWSLQQDTDRDINITKRIEKLSAPGVLIYVLTLTFAGTDWIMSLDPHWFSTILGFIMLSGQGLSTFAMVIAIIILLAHAEPMKSFVTKRHLHDLGKLLFAFTMLWAYLNFSQLVIIWAGNLPEEITWYVTRMNHGWGTVGAMLLMFHFVLPFLVLLSQRIKTNPRQLIFVTIWILCARLLDIFYMIEPNFNRDQFRFNFLDLAAPLAIGGLWMAMFLFQLRQRPLLPINDPLLQKALNHGRHH
jgi:hypothetical protein